MLVNTRQTYGLIAQLLHWLTAVLILCLLVLGVYMHDLPIDTPEQIDQKIWFYSLHKTLGVLAFATAIIRVSWVVTQVHPKPLNGERRFESLLAATIHWVLYGSIIFMPLTGWLHHAALEGFAPIWWPFSQDLPFVPKDPALAAVLGLAHKVNAFLLMGSLALHIAGALKHVVVDQDQTLARMLPWRRVELADEWVEADHKSQPRLIAGSVFALLFLCVIGSQMSFDEQSGSTGEASVSTSSGWMVDPEKSSLDIEVIQNNKPVKGSFSIWQADIVFDPNAVEEASVEVRVETASLTLGGVTKDALSGNFLNVLEYPQAIFISNRFSKLGERQFQAEGELSIAGITRPLILPFELKIENNRAFMEATVELQRLDYELGRKGYTTDGIIGFSVKVMVVLEASRQ